jgi:ribosome-associated protein
LDIRKLQRAIVDGLEDVKAQNIAVFNTEHLTPLFERVIIASGTSNRQTKSLAASVRDAVKASGFPVLRTEGEANGEWIIVDCGAAVAHIMQPGIRTYYHLEEIWGAKPVRMKIDNGAPASLPKASPAKKEPVRKAPAKGAARKTPAKKVAPAKGVARKAPAKRSAAGRPAITRTVGVKGAAPKPAARKSPAGKSPARKRSAAPAKRPPRG